MIPCIAFELAALTSDGDVDKNVTKRPFHVLLYSYPPGRDRSVKPNIRFEKTRCVLLQDLEGMFHLIHRGVFVGTCYITHVRFDFRVRSCQIP